MSRPPGIPYANARAGARDIAFEALAAIEERPVFLRTVLDELCAAFDVDSRERGLALVCGVGVVPARASVGHLALGVVNLILRAPNLGAVILDEP